MSQSAYETGLDRNEANYQPLTPLNHLARAAYVYPDHTAIIHGRAKTSYGDFYARCRRLASALAKRGIVKGDTVSVMLSNTPAMLEAHHGVPMTGAVLHSLNTRLDAGIIAFQLDHSQSKLLIVDREFSGVVAEALKLASVKPHVVDYDDPEYPADAPVRKGDRIGAEDYEALVEDGDPDFAWLPARRRVGRDLAELHLRHHRESERRRLPSSRRRADGLRQRHRLGHGPPSGLSLDAADVPLQRLVLSLDPRRRRRHPCLPALGPGEGDV